MDIQLLLAFIKELGYISKFFALMDIGLFIIIFFTQFLQIMQKYAQLILNNFDDPAVLFLGYSQVKEPKVKLKSLGNHIDVSGEFEQICYIVNKLLKIT